MYTLHMVEFSCLASFSTVFDFFFFKVLQWPLDTSETFPWQRCLTCGFVALDLFPTMSFKILP